MASATFGSLASSCGFKETESPPSTINLRQRPPPGPAPPPVPDRTTGSRACGVAYRLAPIADTDKSRGCRSRLSDRLYLPQRIQAQRQHVYLFALWFTGALTLHHDRRIAIPIPQIATDSTAEAQAKRRRDPDQPFFRRRLPRKWQIDHVARQRLDDLQLARYVLASLRLASALLWPAAPCPDSSSTLLYRSFGSLASALRMIHSIPAGIFVAQLSDQSSGALPAEMRDQHHLSQRVARGTVPFPCTHLVQNHPDA